MSSTIYLGLAVALLGAGFAVLAVVIRDRFSSADARISQSKHSLAAALTVFALAVGSGICFARYAALSQVEGQQLRLKVYNDFSELPKIERLAGTRLRLSIENADTVPLDGTMWLTVALRPGAPFAAQFPSAGPKNKLWIKMRLNAPGFDVSPVLDEIQPVPGDVMTFAWILRARESGDQVVNIRGIGFDQSVEGTIHDRATVVNAMRSIWVKPTLSIESWIPIITAMIGLLGSSALPLLLQALSRRSAQGAQH